MPKNNTSRRAASRATRRSELIAQKRETQIVHNDLSKLMELAKAQEIRFRPEMVDVPRIRFSPKQIYNIELSYALTLVTSTTAATVGAFAFALSNAAAYGSYTAIFDSYRILQVNIKFMPFATGALNPSPGSGAYLYTAIDYDDANAPASPDVLLAYGSLKITPGGVIDERTLVPRAALAAYGGSTFSAYAQANNRLWIDTSSPGTQYYGLKYAFSTSPAVENVRVIVTMAIQFKSQRSS